MTVHFQPDLSQDRLDLHLFPEIRSAHGLFLIIRNSLSPIRFDVLRFMYIPSIACENRLDIRRLCIFDSVLKSLKNALHTNFQIAENLMAVELFCDLPHYLFSITRHFL